jgi:hypothetical protein
LLATRWAHMLSWDFQAVGAWALALALPLGLAYLLRGKGALVNVAWAVWALVIYFVKLGSYQGHLFEYAWAALGSVALSAWGVREQWVDRINLGMLGFAASVLAFFFSNVMDKLGRSASLIGLGVLFLAGGWALGRLRRGLIAQVQS